MSEQGSGALVTGVRFGVFDFDAATGELRRDGVPVRLQPQPARVLSLLVARAGELVTRDELRQNVWGDETFVDFERGLNFCIAQIRSALGDSADAPRFVETLPRRGYRFVAPVSSFAPQRATHEPAAEPAPPPASPRSLVPASPGRTRLIIAASAFLAALCAVGVWATRPSGGPIAIAVFPFDNETSDQRFDEVARGVSDVIVARLAEAERISTFTVIGNAAILQRPRAGRDLQAIGRELGVEYVVLGQVKRDADRVRVVAHLIRVEDQGHVWAKTFDRPAFTLDVQEAIAEEVATAVAVRLRR